MITNNSLELLSHLYDEFNSISYDSPEEAIRQGDYSWALRKTGSEDLKTQLEKILGIRPDFERFVPNLLPKAYDIFYSGKKSPTNRKIRVLLQMMEDPVSSTHGYAKNLRKSSRYDVVNIGFYKDADIMMRPNMTLEEIHILLGDWVPDYYYCHQVEYMCVPIGLDKAPYPVFGHIGDTDLHWINSKDILNMFDLLTVVGSYDHWQTRKITDRPVVVYPKIYGCPKVKTPLFSTRPYDILFTGTSKDLYRWDTQVFLKSLTQVSPSFPIVDGFLSEPYYTFLMGNAKIVPTYVRRWGAFSTRGLEALTMGCCILYQEGGEMGLFFSPEEGAIPYRPDNLEQKSLNILKDWKEKYKQSGKRGAEKTKSEFSMPRVLEEYFDFLSFLAFSTDIEKAKKTRNKDYLIRTPALIYGWLGILGDHPPTHSLEMYQYTLNIQTRAVGDIKLNSAHLKSEISLESFRLAIMGCDDLKKDYGSELTWFFNLGRYKFNRFFKNQLSKSFYEGKERNDLEKQSVIAMRMEIIGLFTEALSHKLGSELDVYDYTYFPDRFDYRSYFDVLWRNSDQGIISNDGKKKATSIIHAYCFGYLFILTKNPTHFWDALGKHPNSHLLQFMLSNSSKIEVDELLRTHPKSITWEIFTKILEDMLRKYPCTLSEENIPFLREIVLPHIWDKTFSIKNNYMLGNKISSNQIRKNLSENLKKLKRYIGYRMPLLKKFYQRIKSLIRSR